MLKKLRSLSPESKRKVVLAFAGFLTFFVFTFWIFNFFGIFIITIDNAATKSASAYSAFEQNVEKVYNTVTKIIPKDILSHTNKNTEIPAEISTTTESI